MNLRLNLILEVNYIYSNKHFTIIFYINNFILIYLKKYKDYAN